MSKSFWIYSAALVALLALAWCRWIGLLGGGEEAATDDVVILRAERAEIERIAYHSEKLDVTLEQRTDGFGTYTWVTLDERKEKPRPAPEAPAADAASPEAPVEAAEAAAEEPTSEEPAAEAEKSEDAKPAEPVEYETTRTEFKGGDATDKLLDALAPFKARRDLGAVGADKLADLELAEPGSWVEVTRKGKVRRIELGGEAYGTRDTYVRDTETGSYYLVDAEIFRPLKFAKSRLPDRRLSALEAKDVARVTLEAPAGRVEILHQNRQDEEAAYWASAAAPDQAVEFYANWLDKALRLKGLSYVAEADKPADLSPVFVLALAPEEGAPTRIQVFSAADAAGGEPEWYAVSDFTRGLMKLHKTLASEAADDLDDVLEARPEPAPEGEEEELAPSEDLSPAEAVVPEGPAGE
jgi:hypothetical protein